MAVKLWNVLISEEPTPKEVEEGNEGRVILAAEKVQAPTRELAIIRAVKESDKEIPINARVQVQVSPF